MNIMHNKTEKFITQLYVTRRMENDVTQRCIQLSAHQPAQIRQVPVAMLQQMFKVTSTRLTQQCRRLRHWSTASSIIVAETRESVGGYRATHVRCLST